MVMADVVFPVSYLDPQYASLDAGTEQKLGLQSGLVSGIREHGERSNANQVSSAGARTPYQITPATREAAIQKWGIDPYLSPQNASEVAGLLLKDSLARNRNDASAAVGEYHGGTNRANWGPKTRAYQDRVLSGMRESEAAPAQPAQQGSTFDRVMAQMQAEQAPSQLQALYQAYQAGQMTPEESAQYEQDVQSGAMMLPRGAQLKSAAVGPGIGGAVAGSTAPPVPPGVMQAYQAGQMTPQEMVECEQDVRHGALQLPQGMTPDALFGPQHQQLGVFGRIRDVFTGESRRTATTDALPDWGAMPELNQLSMASAKTGLGTLLSKPEETAQIIKTNFPGVQVRQDQRGNLILRSSVDGQEYAIKPGFQPSDIPRAAGGILAFTPAGRAATIPGMALRSAATQAAIEGTQAATGGEFNPGDVAAAGALGAAVPAAARVLGMAAAPAKAAIGRVMGRVEPAVAPTAAKAAPATPAATAAPAVTSMEDVAAATRAAAQKGSGSQAARNLAASAAPSPEITSAAERLGIENHLQPDHVTTNDGFRQVMGVVKSNPTSQLALQEKEGLTKVAQRASDLIDEVGGTTDLSALDTGIKNRMQAAHTELSTRENGLYQKLRKAVGPTTEARADNALAFARQRVEELGGEQNLSPMEKTIVSKLSPKGGGDEELLAALGPQAREQAMQQGAGAVKQPTYALLDDVRRDVGAAARMRGPFSDADTGLAKKYYGLLSDDQAAIADAVGAGDIAQAARAATVARKGMEDDLASLFGKNLDQGLVPQVSGAMTAAAKGDASKLIAVLKSTPDDMKQQVVASGVGTTFRTAATRGEMNFTGYAKWFENLQRNKQAYTAVMSNLPAAARQQLLDLYRVSKGISESLSARVKTGLRSSVIQELEGAPDTLASRLYGVAKIAGKGLAVDAVGGHGAGLAIALMSALKGNAKSASIKAIDEMLASPEFQHLATTASSTQQVAGARILTASKPFQRFIKTLKSANTNPLQEIFTNPVRWIRGAMRPGDLQNSGKSARMANPPEITQRPFNEDYPNYSPDHGKGGLETPGPALHSDIEGRPLLAGNIAGRRIAGGVDERVNPAESGGAAGVLGATIREVPAKEISGDLGRYVRSRGLDGETKLEILLRQDMTDQANARVLQHEFGHMIDDLVYGNGIETTGIKKELQQVYHDLNAPFMSGKGKWSPENDGYRGKDIDREYIAEAIRAYLQDPNYLKSVAPKTAARIRAAVNSNQNLNKVIQFNQAGAPIGLSAYLAGNHVNTSKNKKQP
jgi:hypothetical protein